MFGCKVLSRGVQSLHRSQFRHSSRSALFVSGKVAAKQFAVFRPKLDPAWLEANTEMLENFEKMKETPADIKRIKSDLNHYLELREQVSHIDSELEEIQQIISDRKKENADIEDPLKVYKSLRKQLKGLRDVMWTMEEEVVINYLKLHNCDSKSTLKEKVHYCVFRGHDDERLQKNHKELCESNNLVDFSNVSHSAYYLKHDLAKLELKLNQYFTSKLLDCDYEIFSNPDFIKSVMAEGCGIDFLNPEQIFSLRKYQDFGDRESCNAMHLVGGASLAPFVAFFCRQILQVSCDWWRPGHLTSDWCRGPSRCCPPRCSAWAATTRPCPGPGTRVTWPRVTRPRRCSCSACPSPPRTWRRSWPRCWRPSSRCSPASRTSPSRRRRCSTATPATADSSGWR